MPSHFSPVVVTHLFAAVTAVALGVVVLAMRKGTRAHRWLGRTWVAIMAFVAIGSFWIQHNGSLSWIHGLSAFTLLSLASAVWSIRRGRVRAHRQAMFGTFAGLGIAGLFALSPGRLLGAWVFGW